MTDYNEVPLIFTGDWIDAAWLNQYLRDNLRAFKQGLAVAGDIPYALDGNTIAALAKPAGLGFIQNDAVGVPSYFTGGSEYDVLMKAAGNAAFAWGYQRTKFCLVTNAGTQTIPATPTPLSVLFGSDVFDDDGWHSTVSNTNRIIPTVAGEYEALAFFKVNVGGISTVNAISATLLKNNSEEIGYVRDTTEANFDLKVSVPSRAVSMNGTTDYINLTIDQNNAGNLTLQANPYLYVKRVR